MSGAAPNTEDDETIPDAAAAHPFAAFSAYATFAATVPHQGWRDAVLPLARAHASRVDEGLRQEVRRLNGQIPFFPDVADVFRAFAFFDLPETRVVIMGQDCYPNPGEADGLCFSVSRSARCPPSLKNVFAELERTYGVRRTDADLSDWARQGVLLLNTALTVRMGRPGSHLPYWHAFVADVVREVCARTRAVVFLLWGSHAAEYEQCVYEHGQGRGHLVLKHSHPSPLARRPFVGCDHFRVANAFLQANAHKPAVRWV